MSRVCPLIHVRTSPGHRSLKCFTWEDHARSRCMSNHEVFFISIEGPTFDGMIWMVDEERVSQFYQQDWSTDFGPDRLSTLAQGESHWFNLGQNQSSDTWAEDGNAKTLDKSTQSDLYSWFPTRTPVWIQDCSGLRRIKLWLNCLNQ